MTQSRAADILGTDKDQELLQSFVRIGLKAEDEEEHKSTLYSNPNLVKQNSDGKSEYGGDKQTPRTRSKSSGGHDKKKKKRGPIQYFDEVYTDKDRAAAVSIGSYDIKQSLHLKRQKDRNAALQLPEEADPGAILALGMREFKNGNNEIATIFISKALDMNPNDQNALVARSKCYLLLGEPAKALQDAETALIGDKANIRAIYQKAEALYYLGQFEHSLMFFHRGHRLRPELASFRLGIQKTQEAIENTIGEAPKSHKSSGAKSAQKSEKSKSSTNISRPSTTQTTVVESRPKTATRLSKAEMDKIEKRTSRRLLGELCVDKEYLENLLKNPNLKRADTDSENISNHAKEAVQYLNVRQEFWRQQKPCNTLSVQKKVPVSTPLPRWY